MRAWRRRMIIAGVVGAVLLVLAGIMIGPVALLLGGVAGLAVIATELIREVGVEVLRRPFRQPKPPDHLLRDLRRVRDYSPWELGARRSTLAEDLTASKAPPYVRFAKVDDRLDALLRADTTRFVLLHGHAGAGKSRAMAEAIGRHCSDSWLVIPNPVESKSIEQLIVCSDWFRGERGPVIVWLDRLEDYFQSGCLTADRFKRAAACSPPFLFVAMIRSDPLDRLMSGAQLSPFALDGEFLRRLLEEADFPETGAMALHETTELDSRDDTRAAYADLDLSKGIGLALVQRDVYLGAYRASGLPPLVRALVQAAVDLRRVGLYGPFSAEALITAAAKRDLGGARHDRDAWRAALADANRPLGSREELRLLLASGADAWTVDDLLIDIDAGRSGAPERPLDSSAWEAAVTVASGAEFVTLAENAEFAGGPAEMLWNRVIEGGPPEHAAQALYSLGVLYDKGGEGAKAVAAWERVATSEDPEYGPQAMFNLSSMYAELGDRARAKDACERAIASRHPLHAPRAMWNLAVLYGKAGDTDKQIEVLEKASSTEHRDASSRASFHLGRLYEMRGETDKAISAYERTVDLRQVHQEVEAMDALADLYGKLGEGAKAAEWRERASATASQMDYGFY